jgi:hypothetical protein
MFLLTECFAGGFAKHTYFLVVIFDGEPWANFEQYHQSRHKS